FGHFSGQRSHQHAAAARLARQFFHFTGVKPTPQYGQDFFIPCASSRSFTGSESSNQQNRCSSSWPEVSADDSDDSACRLLEGLNSRVSAATCAGCCGENKPEIQEKKPGIHCLRSNVSLRVTVLPDQYSCVKQPCTVRKALRTKLPRTRRPVGTPLRPCPGMRRP